MQPENPFIGPKSYEDGDPFYGREEEIKELFNLTRNEPLTLLFSRSGTGKTSLMKAGLIPYLKKEKEFYPIYIHLNLAAIEAEKANNLNDYVIKMCDIEIRKLIGKQNYTVSISAITKNDSLFEYIHGLHISVLETTPDNLSVEYLIKPLLIFDQFEEIFTQPFKNEQLEELYDEIRYLVENEVPAYLKEEFTNSQSEKIVALKNTLKSKQKNYRIMFAFREEYLPQFESLKRKIPSIRFTNSRFRLEPFSIKTAEEIILKTAPDIAAKAASITATNLAAEILGFDTVKVDPFLLSTICNFIYPELISARNISEASIKLLVENAVENYLKRVYSIIDEPTKKFIEMKLITAEGTKNSVNYNEIKDDPGLMNDIDKLINNPDFRLLSKGQFLDYEHISILHDRLLPPLLKRRKAREAKEQLKSIFRISGVALLVCILIASLFIFMYSKRKKILRAFAYGESALAKDTRLVPDPTIALRVRQLAYQADDNKLLENDLRYAFQEGAFYKTVVTADTSHIFLSCAVSPGGDSILTGCVDGKVILWSSDGRQLKRYQPCRGSVNSVAFSKYGNEILAGSADGVAVLYNIKDSLPIKLFVGHKGYISAVCFSPNGTQILVGYRDNDAMLWNVNNTPESRNHDLMLPDSTPVRTLSHNNIVTSVAFSPDGSQILTGSADLTARLWDTNNGLLLYTTPPNSGTITALAFSPDRSKIAVGSEQGIVTIYYFLQNPDPSIRNPVQFPVHRASINSIAFSADGTQILTASSDQNAKIIDLNGHTLITMTGHTNSLIFAAYSPSKINHVITCSRDTTIKSWTMPEAEDHIRDFYDYGNPIISAAFSPDNHQIVTGSAHGITELWNLKPGPPAATFPNPNGKFVISVAFSQDGRLLTVSTDSTAALWSTKTRGMLKAFPKEGPLAQGIISATFSSQGDSLLVVTGDSTALILSIANAGTRSLLKKKKPVLSAIYSPKGNKILATIADSTAILLDIQGNELLRLKSDGNPKVLCTAFSADGKLVATGSGDKIARVWNVENGHLLSQLTGHWGDVRSIAFSIDGTKIVTSSDDGKIRIWQSNSNWTENGKYLSPTKELHLDFLSQISSAVFSNNGNQVLSVSSNIARIWNIGNPALDISAVIKKIDSLADNLTPKQKEEYDSIAKSYY
jgi:WD40 repeat protein